MSLAPRGGGLDWPSTGWSKRTPTVERARSPPQTRGPLRTSRGTEPEPALSDAGPRAPTRHARVAQAQQQRAERSRERLRSRQGNQRGHPRQRLLRQLEPRRRKTHLGGLIHKPEPSSFLAVQLSNAPSGLHERVTGRVV